MTFDAPADLVPVVVLLTAALGGNAASASLFAPSNANTDQNLTHPTKMNDGRIADGAMPIPH